MSIPIRPRDIEVPKDDPFKNDLLDRKKAAESLTDVVRSFEGPGVVAIDAAWGTGKTTFLRMWVQHLRNDNFTVVQFNAWDTDFTGDPFLALSTELQTGLDTCGATIPKDAMKAAKEWSLEILKHGPPELARLAASSVPLVGEVSGKLTESAINKFTQARVTSYTKTKEAVSGFRSSLAQIATIVSEASENRPLVVVIDELDRCRPTYSVELLEAAKHLFSVDHVVFVLAIDRTQLVHSISALYGDRFDASTYLHRFVDATIRLPKPKRDELVAHGLQIVDLEQTLSNSRDRDANMEARMATEMLSSILRMSSVDIRTVLQALHRLGLVVRSTPDNYPAFLFSLALATVVSIHSADTCRALSQGRASDKQAVDAVRGSCSVRDWNDSGETPFFEANVIRLVMDQSGAEGSESRTPLYAAYKETLRANPEPEDGGIQPIEIRRLRKIQRFIERWRTMGSPSGLSSASEFTAAFARLDMVSGVAPGSRFPS